MSPTSSTQSLCALLKASHSPAVRGMRAMEPAVPGSNSRNASSAAPRSAGGGLPALLPDQGDERARRALALDDPVLRGLRRDHQDLGERGPPDRGDDPPADLRLADPRPREPRRPPGDDDAVVRGFPLLPEGAVGHRQTDACVARGGQVMAGGGGAGGGRARRPAPRRAAP